MSRVIDLSHTIHDGLVTYPGLPAPVISDYMSREASRKKYAEGTTFQIGRIDMVANTGTYLDTPAHRYADGADLSSFPLERTVDLEGVVVDATNGRRAIGADLFEGRDLRGRAVLIRTGWARHFATAAYGSVDHPFLTRQGAEALVAGGATLVGIDSVNIDDMADGLRPAHTALLAADIAIVEHLRGLEALPAGGFRFFAAAPKFRSVGTFPVRAFALLG